MSKWVSRLPQVSPIFLCVLYKTSDSTKANKSPSYDVCKSPGFYESVVTCVESLSVLETLQSHLENSWILRLELMSCQMVNNLVVDH